MITKKYLPIGLLAVLMTTLSSCELAKGIFKTGVWTGIIIVVLVLALIIWLLSKVFGGKG